MGIIRGQYLLVPALIILVLITIYLGYSFVSISYEYEKYKEKSSWDKISVLFLLIGEIKIRFNWLLWRLGNISYNNVNLTYTETDGKLILVYTYDISSLSNIAEGAAKVSGLTLLSDALLNLRIAMENAYSKMLTKGKAVISTLLKDINTIKLITNDLTAIHNELAYYPSKGIDTDKLSNLSEELSLHSIKIFQDIDRL